MIVTTTENLVGYRVKEVKGQVFGVVVRSRGLVGNIAAGLRTIMGGEITEYTSLLEEARRHAVDRMVQNAQAMGANAIIMMRFDSSEIGQVMSEIVAYGTAAVVEKVRVLRKAVLGFALLLLACGLVLLVVQPGAAFPPLAFGAILTLGTVFERWRYKPAETRQSARGQPTGERFVDPESGDLMEVYYEASTGERSYVRVSPGKATG
jgi:uncharacterized protein YbjQ (UPF0145 family)